MPNNITNRLTITGNQESINKLFETIKGTYDNGTVMGIDFNKIVPTPKNIYQGKFGEKERQKYGKNNWYDWNRKNWGTKWNAYSIVRKDNYVEFDTAWDTPTPVIQKLAEMFPDVVIEQEWADENTGYNTGRIVYDDGVRIENYYNNNSNEAFETYVKLKGKSSCIGKDKDGNWIRYDCDDNCPNKGKC